MDLNEGESVLEEASRLAEKWQDRANELLTRYEKTIQKKMRRLLTHPMDKVILTRMIDQSFRSGVPERVADQIAYVLGKEGIPEFFAWHEKLLVYLFLGVGRYLPRFTVPRVIEQIRSESSRAIIPGEEERLREYLSRRKDMGVRININHLGEAVLGEDEAACRLETYIKDLNNPAIEYISVKISTIYSQINSLAFEATIEVLEERLARLFRAARDNIFVRHDGTKVPKFVNLDMEEFRDLEITSAAFTRTLDMEEFKNYSAGIVLQAYLPDSWQMQKQLTEWAVKRVDGGGASIKIRIVKGANLEMEQVESALYNWSLAPYDNKLDVDANYKRMVDYGMNLSHIHAVNLGIASHNLFELAYACTVGKKRGVTEYFNFEMLEGMADHVRRAIGEISGEVLLYAPVAGKDQFINAIAYLIRRLDENTAPENFLRYASDLKTGSKEWTFLKERFEASWKHRDLAPETGNRIQDRNTETWASGTGTFYENRFINESDTDWSLASNRAWAGNIRDKWMKKAGGKPIKIPVVIAGEEVFYGRVTKEIVDPSSFNEKSGGKVVTSVYALGNDEDLEKAIHTAKSDPDGWRGLMYEKRHEILSNVAVEIRNARADLIGAAAANTGKLFTEADVEVSEAIDFVEYYPFSARALARKENLQCSGKGVGLVISPWNFPLAIPCGGIAATLAAGNTVIFKPASDAVLSAWELCKCFWKGGVSKKVLQFMPCSGSTIGSKLASHGDVDFVILTGGTDTGMTLLRNKPELALAAETGGKNATIVTSMSDRDQAIKNIIYSAYGNTGQKCSATSLLVLEKDVYDDKNFRKQLVDAAVSWHVGPAWDFNNKMGPLVNPPSGDLLRCLTQLERGEEWALKPKQVGDNPYIWTPGIKWNVTPGSYTHMTEFFGPVLGVVRAENLDHAISIVNHTGFGLTSAIESLDRREQEIWKQGIKAGNLYVNRGTTGAIVLRQPFGGMGKSAMGAGIKAGGPNYVSQFMDIEEIANPLTGAVRQEHHLLRLTQEWDQKVSWGKMKAFRGDIMKTVAAVRSYLQNWEEEFSRVKDYFNLRGQDNILRYLPVGTVKIRVHAGDSLFDVLGRTAAALISGNKIIVSIPTGLENDVTEFLAGQDGKYFTGESGLCRETDSELAAGLSKDIRLRYAANDRVPGQLFKAAAETGHYISRTPVMMEGRIELLKYLREQSICDNYHRYGNLGERSLSPDLLFLNC